MKIIFRSIFFITAAWLLLACTALHVPNAFLYQFTDNQSVDLLEFEYADFQRTYTKEISSGLGTISFTAARVGESLKIKWRVKNENTIRAEEISLSQGLPFNMREAKVRLTFNSSNQPEVYVFYNGPDPYSFFWFKGYPYSQMRVRQIYPKTQEIKININQ